MITRELVGVSRSDAGVAAAGVGGRLEAWITYANKTTVDIWFTTNSSTEASHKVAMAMTRTHIMRKKKHWIRFRC